MSGTQAYFFRSGDTLIAEVNASGDVTRSYGYKPEADAYSVPRKNLIGTDLSKKSEADLVPFGRKTDPDQENRAGKADFKWMN